LGAFPDISEQSVFELLLAKRRKPQLNRQVRDQQALEQAREQAREQRQAHAFFAFYAQSFLLSLQLRIR
jgi:hypothetical protein